MPHAKSSATVTGRVRRRATTPTDRGAASKSDATVTQSDVNHSRLGMAAVGRAGAVDDYTYEVFAVGSRYVTRVIVTTDGESWVGEGYSSTESYAHDVVPGMARKLRKSRRSVVCRIKV